MDFLYDLSAFPFSEAERGALPLAAEMLPVLSGDDVVEDDRGHRRLIEKNLRRSNITDAVLTVGDEKQALGLLSGKGEYAESKRPSPLLMLPDLNLPVLDGYQRFSV